SKAYRPTQSCAPSSSRCRCRSNETRTLMAISGRFVALVALGIVPVVVLNDASVFLWWMLLAAALTVLDLAIAGSPRRVKLERTTRGPVRLGETTSTTLYLTNEGRRTVRGIVRDGWPPSAG